MCLGDREDTCTGLGVDTCLDPVLDTCLGLGVDTYLGPDVVTCLGPGVDTCLGMGVVTCLDTCVSSLTLSLSLRSRCSLTMVSMGTPTPMSRLSS